MDIREAKQQIKNAMAAYFAKDEFGNYQLPPQKQRPVFLLGAPGIGKTAIMEQIARELDVAFVSYSMTHHTRQSALGLPFIATKCFDGVEYNVSEYTMSEIIASVYETMEETGLREGILFLDEINCVSETLTPAMLQFLQYKIFGRHKVPDGWIVVTAGNPPEYNRTVHDFDIATWDRLKRIEVEPDYTAWRDYAVEEAVHPSVITYLDIKRDHFYKVETTVDGKSFVTARAWDDLSAIIKLYEAQEIPVDEHLISQYVQNIEIAKRFSVYYDLFTKYRSDYQIERILEGTEETAVYLRAQEALFDERVSFMGLLNDALAERVRKAVLFEGAVGFIHGQLKEIQAQMEQAETEAGQGVGTYGVADQGVEDRVVAGVNAAANGQAASSLPTLEALCEQAMVRIAQKQAVQKKAQLLSKENYVSYERAVAFFKSVLQGASGAGAVASSASGVAGDMGSASGALGTSAPALTFDVLKQRFSAEIDQLEALNNQASSALDNAFSFVERVFGEGQEMLMLVTDVSANTYTMRFINEQGCERYFKHNRELLFADRSKDLAQRIAHLQE